MLSPIDVRFRGTRSRFGWTCCASATGITFLTPRAFTSFAQVIMAVRSVALNGTIVPGRPRRRGSGCCSTEVKNPSKSRYAVRFGPIFAPAGSTKMRASTISPCAMADRDNSF